MKFRFLGDGDCPDWLLAAINTLSRTTYPKILLIGRSIVGSLKKGELDEEQVKNIAQNTELELNDAKVVIAAVELILTSSARYDIFHRDLSSELQQLGLPKEHSMVLVQLYKTYCNEIAATLSSQSLRVSKVTSFEVVASDSSSPFTTINLTLSQCHGTEECSTFKISKDDVEVLLTELKRAKTVMESL